MDAGTNCSRMLAVMESDAAPKGRIDGELLASCRSGDRHAMRRLFDLTVNDAKRILYRLGADAEELEDLLQQVYVAVFSSLGSFRREAEFSTWLYSICLHVFRRHRRSVARWMRRRSIQHEQEQACQGPELQVEKKEIAARVRQTLRKLPSKHREVLVLSQMEGLSAQQVARILNVPVGTVWTRLHHARKAFRRRFRYP